MREDILISLVFFIHTAGCWHGSRHFGAIIIVLTCGALRYVYHFFRTVDDLFYPEVAIADALFSTWLN